MKKKNSSNTHPRLPVPVVPWGFKLIEKKVVDTSPSISCWALTSGSKMKNKMKKYSSQTLLVPTLPRGFKFIEEMLQTRAHQ
jgi:hypothetical protein